MKVSANGCRPFFDVDSTWGRRSPARRRSSGSRTSPTDPTETTFAEYMRVCVPLCTRRGLPADVVARIEMNTALPPELVRDVRYPDVGHGVFRDRPEATEGVREFLFSAAETA